jgi:hypothetical protein
VMEQKCQLRLMKYFLIYYSFLALESVQLQAYEARIANSFDIDQAPPESLDYVYRCYVQQIGLRLEAEISLGEKESLLR